MPHFLKRDGQPALAYHFTESSGNEAPAIVFCGGYRSDMEGTKAIFLEDQCKRHNISYLRFDYRGHGQSEGVFDECVISDWHQDAHDIIAHTIKSPFILVGSSMGGWISLLLEKRYRGTDQLKAVIGIAAAPDFTEDMFHQRLTPTQQNDLIETGIVYIPNDYSDKPYSFTRAFYEDGKTNLLLSSQQKPACNIHLLQGLKDVDVPPETAKRIQGIYNLNDNDITYIKDGDHRLSSPEQLDILWNCIKKQLNATPAHA